VAVFKSIISFLIAMLKKNFLNVHFLFVLKAIAVVTLSNICKNQNRLKRKGFPNKKKYFCK